MRISDKAGNGQVASFHLTALATSAVEQALERAVQRHLESMATLQQAIEACVLELRAQGLPPETMLVTMKAFIRHTATAHPPPGIAASSWAADGYLEQIVRWSIAEYYRPTA